MIYDMNVKIKKWPPHYNMDDRFNETKMICVTFREVKVEMQTIELSFWSILSVVSV